MDNNYNNQNEYNDMSNYNTNTTSENNVYQSSINTNIGDNNKKNNKVKWIIIIVLALIVIGVAIYFLIPKNDNSGSSKGGDNTPKKEEKKNNTNDDGYTEVESDTYNIAIFSHIDQGKEELTSAISKLYGTYVDVNDVKKPAEEVDNQGIKYEYKKYEFKTDNKSYIQHYLPSYGAANKALASGSIKLDGAIIVVSAKDGVQAQTTGYINVLGKVGVKRVVIFIDKYSDDMDSTDIDNIITEIKNSLDSNGFDSNNTPIIKGDSIKAINGDETAISNIKELMKESDEWFRTKKIDEGENHKKVKAYTYILTKEEGGRHTFFSDNYSPELFLDSNDNSKVTINLVNGQEMVLPGDTTTLEITLDDELELEKYQEFRLKENGILVGGGIITEFLD